MYINAIYSLILHMIGIPNKLLLFFHILAYEFHLSSCGIPSHVSQDLCP